MAPSAIVEPAVEAPVNLKEPVALAKATAQQVEHASGDPGLAFIHDETTAPPTFSDPYEERKYLKHRLALAFRYVLTPFIPSPGVR
jgi:hypothetical protein